MISRRLVAVVALSIGLAVAGCAEDGDGQTAPTTTTPSGSISTAIAPTTVSTAALTPLTTTAPATPTTTAAPTTAVPTSTQITSSVLERGSPIDRALSPSSFLGLAPDGFASTIGPVPTSVLARSSWRPECPVARDDLVYLTVPHWGFDGREYIGEVLTNARFGAELVVVFERLHELEFPIEELRVLTLEEVTRTTPPSDTNTSSSFECRSSVGSTRWSRHAFGLAIDINPFHNPYRRKDVVLPSGATAYLDRESQRPGMLRRGDGAVEAFDAIGWTWGGEWRSLKDWMHFSDDGR